MTYVDIVTVVMKKSGNCLHFVYSFLGQQLGGPFTNLKQTEKFMKDNKLFPRPCYECEKEKISDKVSKISSVS